jgi:hypothetical protein
MYVREPRFAAVCLYLLWFSLSCVTDDNRPGRVADAFPGFCGDIVAWQHSVDVPRDATALIGFSQGAIADVIPFIGHTIDDELIELLLQRLQSHVPRRIWDEATRDQP